MERKYSGIYEFLLIFFGIIVFSVGYAVKKYSANISIFYDSLKTPWGIVTAPFVYDGVANAVVYAFFVILFIAANAAYSRSLQPISLPGENPQISMVEDLPSCSIA